MDRGEKFVSNRFFFISTKVVSFWSWSLFLIRIYLHRIVRFIIVLYSIQRLMYNYTIFLIFSFWRILFILKFLFFFFFFLSLHFVWTWKYVIFFYTFCNISVDICILCCQIYFFFPFLFNICIFVVFIYICIYLLWYFSEFFTFFCNFFLERIFCSKSFFFSYF